MIKSEKIYSENDIMGLIGTIGRINTKKHRALRFGDYKAYHKYSELIDKLNVKLFNRIAANIIARLSKQDANQ